MLVPAILAGITASAGLTACRTYEPRPIDLDRVERVFRDRTIPPDPTTDGSDAAVRLSLDPTTAEHTALLLNADLRDARARAGVAEATALHAGLWPDPVIGLQFTRILESVASPNELFGTLGFTLPISGRLEAEKTRLGRTHAAALVEVANLEWRTRLDVRDAWSRWRATTVERDATAAFIAALDELLAIVASLETSGDLSRVEARLFRLARTDAALSQLDLDARVVADRLAILDLIGLPPDARIELDPDAPIQPGPTEDEAPPTSERFPAVRLALARYEVAEAALDQAIRAQLPDLGVLPGYGTQDGSRQFTLGLSIPIPILNGNRQAIETAAAAREASAVAVTRSVERTLAAIERARVRITRATRRRELIETDLVPLLELQFEETRTLARLGQVDTLVLLDGLERRREAMIATARADLDLQLARRSLADLVGPTPADAPAIAPLRPDASIGDAP